MMLISSNDVICWFPILTAVHSVSPLDQEFEQLKNRFNATHLISEWSKLAQTENKTIHDRVGKVIHWELSKRFSYL